jgi:hypothetical protein
MTRRTAIASAPRIVKTKYGQKMVINCRLNDGETVTIWKSADDEICKFIANGERILLDVFPSGRTGESHYFKIVETSRMRSLAVQANLAAIDKMEEAIADRYKLLAPLGF